MDQLPPPPETPAPPTAPRRRVWLIVGAGVLGLVIVAAAVAVLNGGSGGQNVAATTPSATATPVATPSTLRARPGAFQVRLVWKIDDTGVDPVDHYDIQRGTQVVGHADGAARTWTDDKVIPSQHYHYRVTAISAAGERSGAAVAARTKAAPPGTAGLSGVFNVKLHVTSYSGFSSSPTKDTTAGWKFTPTCATPPCNTVLKDIHFKDLVVTLEQHGASYHGSKTVSGLVSCAGQHGVSTTVTIAITATKAAAVHDDWRVVSLSGTVSEYSSPQLGCTSSSVHYDVVGRLIQA